MILIQCIECEKVNKDNPMMVKETKKNDDEYHHLAEITDYVCAEGHQFRIVYFL